MGTGTAVVSTPYIHAKEVLSHGRGLFCEFRNSDSITDRVKTLLEDEELRKSMEKKAYRYCRSFTWPNVARKYADIFEQAIHDKGERACESTPDQIRLS